MEKPAIPRKTIHATLLTISACISSEIDMAAASTAKTRIWPTRSTSRGVMVQPSVKARA